MKYELNDEQLEETRIALYNMGLDIQEMKAENSNYDELESLEKAEILIAEVLNKLTRPMTDLTEMELPFK